MPRRMPRPRIGGPTLRDALRAWRFWAFAVGVLAGAIPLHMVLIHHFAAVSDPDSKGTGGVRPRPDRNVYRPAMIFMGLLADRMAASATGSLGMVDDRHRPADDGSPMSASLDCSTPSRRLSWSFSRRGVVLFRRLPPSLPWRIVRRDHRRDLAIFRRRGGAWALARGVIYDWTGNYQQASRWRRH